MSQLELQLEKERERLHAMMAHLRMTKEADIKNPQPPPPPPKRDAGLTLSPGPPMVNDRAKVSTYVYPKLVTQKLLMYRVGQEVG